MQTLEDSVQGSSRLINDKSQPHEPSEATQQNHAITKDLLSQAERLTKGPVCKVFRVDEKTVVKTGGVVRMAEAATLSFVRDKTSVPVPKVLDAYVHAENKRVYIVMEYIDGRSLDDEWDSYDKSQKQSVQSQLRKYLDEIGQIPGTFVGSVDGSECRDPLFDDVLTRCGPFESESAFHEGLIHAVQEKGSHPWIDMVIRFLKAMPSHKIVLTHNDLAPRNILVRNAKVVGIVDWEFAGFYPEYWEYVKAFCWPDWQSSWIKEGIIDRILEPYLLELEYIAHARDIIWSF